MIVGIRRVALALDAGWRPWRAICGPSCSQEGAPIEPVLAGHPGRWGRLDLQLSRATDALRIRPITSSLRTACGGIRRFIGEARALQSVDAESPHGHGPRITTAPFFHRDRMPVISSKASCTSPSGSPGLPGEDLTPTPRGLAVRLPSAAARRWSRRALANKQANIARQLQAMRHRCGDNMAKRYRTAACGILRRGSIPFALDRARHAFCQPANRCALNRPGRAPGVPVPSRGTPREAAAGQPLSLGGGFTRRRTSPCHTPRRTPPCQHSGDRAEQITATPGQMGLVRLQIVRLRRREAYLAGAALTSSSRQPAGAGRRSSYVLAARDKTHGRRSTCWCPGAGALGPQCAAR